MVNPQNPIDQVRKRHEQSMESGYANQQDEKAINKERDELAKERKVNYVPSDEEGLPERIDKGEFKNEKVVPAKKWWQFWK